MSEITRIKTLCTCGYHPKEAAVIAVRYPPTDLEMSDILCGARQDKAVDDLEEGVEEFTPRGRREGHRRRIPKGEGIRKEFISEVGKVEKATLKTLAVPGAAEWWYADYMAFTKEFAEGVGPEIQAIWESEYAASATRLVPTFELNLEAAVAQAERASLALSETTLKTLGDNVNGKLAAIRTAIAEGMAEGLMVPDLTDAVNAAAGQVFDRAKTYQARRIAVSEASRAFHAGQLQAAKDSGTVKGMRWLMSDDACEICRAIGTRVTDAGEIRAAQVDLGQPFGTFGDNADYSEVMHPPVHPNCQCTIVEVIYEVNEDEDIIYDRVDTDGEAVTGVVPNPAG